ncbi:hypothetical protein Leryth_023315 [Lithospermum erythrorhizon]|nr:hypothetical protein Leryth_023315 [Lithospermum erythrorhizon]
MIDGRRHSVDVPISKTLVALRRVRSLRDPSTNSMSKFSALVENWETHSSNGINLGFENVLHESDDHNRRLKNSYSHKKEEEHAREQALYHCSRKSNPGILSHGTSLWVENLGRDSPKAVHVQMPGGNQLDQAFVFESKPLPRKYGWNDTDKGLDVPCITPSSDCIEGVGSCNAFSEGSTPVAKTAVTTSRQRYRYNKNIRSSRPGVGDVFSCAGSPTFSNDSPLPDSSAYALSLYRNTDNDVVDFGQGCKISCCWSSTPSHRESNLLPDAEERPLMLGEPGQHFQSDNMNFPDDKVDMYPSNPSSFSQKYRPKSFDKLVGQYAVARSLVGAISTERITPLYLFHGPRGTGKTSASTIFAAALNCLSPEIEKPCGLCQECSLFFSGRCRDFKEVDCVKMNQTEMIRSLNRSAQLPPVASRFKVFIIDECHLLRDEAWATVLKSLHDLSLHVIFILVTPYLDRLPRSVVSRSQRHHFPKIKEADIAKKLERMCVEEDLEFDQDALELIGAKSIGSLRDAEMMLEQLSLLGKRITVPLVYELIGVVSDDELIGLLRLALSVDTSSTVKRARELMRSVDPMQLVSQLANIIMDILAENCGAGITDTKRKLFGGSTCAADVQQLNYALKILTEAETQLRTSKNQSTWLTVALLQLSSTVASRDTNDYGTSMRTLQPQDTDFCSTSSTGESLKNLESCSCGKNGSCGVGIREESLEVLWRNATGICPSSSLRNLLQKRGKLLSISFNQGIAVADLAFNHPKYVSKAEKSWKLIASALQSSLGCNVEIRIKLVNFTSSKACTEKKKPYFNLFRCSRRKNHKSDSATECDSRSHYSDITFKGATIMDSSDHGSQISHTCSNGKTSVKIIRSSDGNGLSIGVTQAEPLKTNQLKIDYPSRGSCESEDLYAPTVERQACCASTCESLRRKSNASSTCQTFCHSIQAQNNIKMSSPSKGASETNFSGSDPFVSLRSINDDVDGSGDKKQSKFSKSRCWRTAMFCQKR